MTVADISGDGRLDLLVGDAEGDVLILLGNGDGSFRPFEPVKAAIALAVADFAGNGILDFIFADQSLSTITVQYGPSRQSAANTKVIANQSTGLLAPGAVKLADMNGDGIQDLIVANSGGNNVLVYPGLGNGQFGPPVGGTAGFPVGTDPTGLTVASLNGQPDLLVADTGSNGVSVLLGEGTGSSWTMIPGPRIETGAGPVATVVGNLFGSSQTELAVANSQADTVQVFPSLGGGFFNDEPQAVTTYPVGQDPAALFSGNFTGFGLGSGDPERAGKQRDLARRIRASATRSPRPLTPGVTRPLRASRSIMAPAATRTFWSPITATDIWPCFWAAAMD